jgi:L-alanine-DL-glutamate epimerase-like enolase superfamily enzyme
MHVRPSITRCTMRAERPEAPAYKLLGGLCQDASPRMVDQHGEPIREDDRGLPSAREGIRHPVLCVKAGGKPAGSRMRRTSSRCARRWAGRRDRHRSQRRLDVSETIRVMRQVADYRPDYLEQPVKGRTSRAWPPSGRDCGRAADGRRRRNDLADAYALAKADAVDAFCVKLYKMGGCARRRRSRRWRKPRAYSSIFGGLAVLSQLEAAAGAHFYASCPERHIMPAAEFIFGLGVAGPDPLVPDTDFVIKDGHVTPPSRPGLGVAVDERAVERYTLKREVVKK